MKAIISTTHRQEIDYSVRESEDLTVLWDNQVTVLLCSFTRIIPRWIKEAKRVKGWLAELYALLGENGVILFCH